ncbi:MAG TPA: alpha-L-arabinofuranosidase, partial [Candidatus Paceibacterota bacterium]|nr:alpha-L-arabinofuranosidase [Candidatus Paceibacterota bacterium]
MLFVVSAACAQGQTPLPIYTDRLVNGFQDWSWANRDLNNTSPVYSGANSIQVTASTWEAASFHHADFDSRLYSDLTFWANGGVTGGQRLQVKAEFGTNSGPAVALPVLPTNSWQRFSVPLSALGVANKSNLNRLTIQLASGGTSGTFYLDQIQLNAVPAPALVHLDVNATQALRSVDPRWFSVNTAIWDSNFDTAETVALMNDIGARMLRFPGGSLSDEYHWAINKTSTNTWQWATPFASFVHVATNIGAQAMITVNYGTGTPVEAASWVRHSNVTNHFGFRYWEIGNEIYGDWETDTNSFPHDPYTYAVRATNFIAQMKAADPAIKIGIVVAAGENSFSNAYTLNHPAINPRTGATNYGWTPILLGTLKQLGVTPDFVSHHVYPEYTAQESDPLLLQSTVNWARDAADLRQQITDYFGPAGTNIELLVTENNSNAGDQGKQST